MMKLLGISVLFLAAFGSGVVFSQRLNKRLAELRNMEKLTQRVQVWLEFRGFSTEEIMDRLACDIAFSGFSFLPYCRDLIQKEDVAFPEAWKKAIEEKKSAFSLREEELQVLISFSEIIGSASVQRQISSLQGMKKELQRLIDEAQKECRKKGKLYRSLGALSGAAMAIITI